MTLRRTGLLAGLAALASCYSPSVSSSGSAGTADTSAGGASESAASASGNGSQSSSPGTSAESGPGGCAGDDECDDDNPCSLDSCNAGSCAHAPNTDDPTCSCEAPADCTQLPMDDDCRTRACEDGVCSLDFADAGTPLNETQQTAEDCQRVVCDGNGSSEIVDDDGDLPIDEIECTEDKCEAGVPSNPPLPANTDCAAGKCNDVGQCVGCNVPEDCGGTTTFCQVVTCESGVCGLDVTDVGTEVPDVQSEGDCQVVQCDGRGNAASVADDDDLPADDGVACSGEVCTAGVASHPALVGDACDDGLFCTANDTCNADAACVGVGDPCPGPDGDSNCAEQCDEGSDTCTAFDPNGAACNDGLFCNGADTCSGGACSVHGTSPCSPDPSNADCSESCNEGTDDCTANDANGTGCNDGVFCNGSDTCSSGSCSGHSGSPCPGADGDLDCSETCDEGSDSCTANDPNNSDCGDCRHCSNGSCINECGGGICCEDGICINPPQECP